MTAHGESTLGEVAQSGAGSFPVALLAECRAAVAECIEALRDARAAAGACPERELAAVAAELAELRALAGAGLIAVVAEAQERGVVEASRCASTAAWVAEVAWHSRQESATIAKAAALFGRESYAPIVEALAECDVDPGTAVVVGGEFGKLEPDLKESARPVVLDRMLDVGAEHGPSAVRKLKDEILARYGPEDSFDEECERRRRHIELSPGRRTAGGMWEYRLTVDGEGRSVLEAVIGPGSAPTSPGSATGVRDTRPVGRRRGEALIEALRRSVTAAGYVPTAPKAILMVTVDERDLTHRVSRSWVRGRGGAGAGVGQGLNLGAGTHAGAEAGPSRGTEAGVDTQPGVGAAAARETGVAANVGAGRGTAASDCADPAGRGTAAGAGWDVALDTTAGDSGDAAPGAGVVLGSRAAGELIDPTTLRRIACDAGVIPVVLGGNGEVLDQGVITRLFTTPQVRALWRRDGHCSFPACDIPAAWCDAHHLVHWADGGPTGLDNGALLCRRHHTIVHRDQLAGRVTHPRGAPDRQLFEPFAPPGPAAGPAGSAAAEPHPRGSREHRPLGPRRTPSVTWDLRPDSYRRALEAEGRDTGGGASREADGVEDTMRSGGGDTEASYAARRARSPWAAVGRTTARASRRGFGPRR